MNCNGSLILVILAAHPGRAPMIVSHKHRFIFLKTRKTAGTSVEYALRAVCGDRDVITPTNAREEAAFRGRGPQNTALSRDKWSLREFLDWKLRRKAKLRGGDPRYMQSHMTAAHCRRVIGEEVWGSYYRFSVERNPWDRQVSLYYWRYRNSHRKSFEEFLREEPPPILPNWLSYTINDRVVMHRIIRFEDLEAGYREALKDLGIEYSSAPLASKMKGSTRQEDNYRSLYTQKTTDMVAMWYDKEIRQFNYEF
jgi:hypothetical protein